MRKEGRQGGQEEGPRSERLVAVGRSHELDGQQQLSETARLGSDDIVLYCSTRRLPVREAMDEEMK